RQVAYEVALPEGAAGTYWLALYFEGEPSQGASQEVRPGVFVGISAQVRYRAVVIVSSRDAAEPALRVAGLRHSGDLRFEIDLENEGNVHLRPVGELQILDASGALAGVIGIP